ncbi:MAG: MBL fold metallo-hydrolase [Oscillospiraceae bacterium]|jgi:L-ascorbate metabolism protein UlaG (beta-lactamase superfamily)|nr:MBL fold metallo-hydrolase [Oscillospiraceae bacterium]
MNAEIRYLHHSAFSLETDHHFLIFDYYLDVPKGCGLSKGVVDPEQIRDKNVVVFASHSHPDHYSPRIFSWRKTIPTIRYLLASQIHPPEDAVKIAPNETINLGDLSVRGLESTDEGVAFLIRMDGLCIYHAGDLNWWHWDGEPEDANAEMGRRYREQIDTLRGEKIDVAFLPVDPRQKQNALLGFNYFMKTVGANAVIPMHSFGKTEFYEPMKTDPYLKPWREKILFYQNRGDIMTY